MLSAEIILDHLHKFDHTFSCLALMQHGLYCVLIIGSWGDVNYVHAVHMLCT